MTVTISGSTGVSLCDTNSVPTAAIQASAVTQPKVGSGVAGNGPAFSAYLTSNQTVSAATSTKVQLGTKEFDTNNNFDNTTNYRFTPTVAGYYQINASLFPNSSTSISSNVAAYIAKNGSQYKTYMDYNLGSGNGATCHVSAVVYLNGTTDYVELYGYIAGGTGTLRFEGGSLYTYMTGALVRAA